MGTTTETLPSRRESETLAGGLQGALDVGIPTPTTQAGLDVRGYRPIYLNDRGDVTLRTTRWLLDFDSPGDRGRIIDSYTYWVETPVFLEIRERTTEGLKRKTRWLSIKASKRGNDVANRALQRRLTPIRDAMRESEFSIDGTHTRLLYITLTWDTKLCSASDSWYRMGEDFDRFMARLRKRFGKVSYVRAWEGSDRDYAHVHLLVLFEETSFVWFEHVGKDGKKTYRIVDKWRKEIGGEWNYAKKRHEGGMWHSHVDIQAVVDNGLSRLHDVLSYVVKFKDDHVDPETWNDKETRTMSALWYHRLRQFAVSGRFEDDLTRRRVVTRTAKQTNLEGDVITVVRYDFLGLVDGSEAGLDPDIWFKTHDRPPPFLELVWRPYSRSRSNALAKMGFK